ncbi:PE family protein [Mycobacterium kubicae]|uniref:PE family protein n=1 Tax=Mycobacterium kubicae TaxID=120959 RepID=UPI000B0BAE73|nr:PE family protein [Mycobacterium kubicae]
MMSYLTTAPEALTAAAGDLAGIRSLLGDAAAAAAGPTSSVAAAAADDISAAVSQFFGSYGHQFQSLNAQASAFHDEFVRLLNSSANAYLTTEIANAEQNLLHAINAPAQALLAQAAKGADGMNAGAAALRASVKNALSSASRGGAASLLAGRVAADVQAVSAPLLGAQSALFGSPALLRPAATGPLAVGGAYQSLFATTQANLALLNQTWSANPAPFLAQVIANQQSYAQTFGSALQSAAHDFGAGLAALPAAYQATLQALVAGDVSAAAQALGKGYLNLVFTGFDYSNVPTVTLEGALGDLLPIAAIPGVISQNMTNVLKTMTDASITTNISLVNPSFTTGLPLTLALDALGAPILSAQAALQSGTTFLNALQAGDAAGAFGALVDAPAVIANGFLNGQGALTLALPTSLSPVAGTQSLTAAIPIGGILAPAKPVVATAVVHLIGPPITQEIPLGGTQFGGLLPSLLSASGQLATVIKPVG